MYKIGVIGDFDSVCGFGAVGLDIFPVESAVDAEQCLKKLAESDYGIIYITEYYIEQLPECFEKYKAMQIPAVIPIPSNKGASGFGIKAVKGYVEQAVGSDIIFGED